MTERAAEPSREPLGSLGHFIEPSAYAPAAPCGYPIARLLAALDGLGSTKHLLSALSDSPHRDLRFTASGAFHPFAGRRHPDPSATIATGTMAKIDNDNVAGLAFVVKTRTGIFSIS